MTSPLTGVRAPCIRAQGRRSLFEVCAMLPACDKAFMIDLAGENVRMLRDLWQCRKASEPSFTL